ncbi:MAG: CIA30 family protein [Sumerlaeia bacterium]
MNRFPDKQTLKALCIMVLGISASFCHEAAYAQAVQPTQGAESTPHAADATSAQAQAQAGAEPTQTKADSMSATEPLKPNEQYLLFEADAPELGWRVVNDSVMGGVSSSTWKRTEDRNFEFTGVLSLENNGGFASVRSDATDFGLTVVSAFVLRVKGDGRTYQLRFRTNGKWDGVAYAQSFETVAGEWVEVELPFSGFIPTWRGQIVSDAPPLDAKKIEQVTWMVADKKSGPFKLEIDWVKTLSGTGESIEDE